MKDDKNTKIQTLKKIIKEFRDQRDWEQFHDPKNLAEAISIEAGELQEMFLWDDIEKVKNKMEDEDFRKEVEDELADIIIFCIHFANATDIDISEIIERKINKNGKKYPEEKARGKSDKYDKL